MLRLRTNRAVLAVMPVAPSLHTGPMRLHLHSTELMPCTTVASHAGRALARFTYAATDGHFTKLSCASQQSFRR